ncbi:MAG: aspartyl protease family protein [Ekhidna sp.]
MKRLTSLLTLLIGITSFAQTPITSIPFELFGDHIIIKVSVDDSDPLNFIFDTGSGYTVIDEDVAKELGLTGKSIDMNSASTTWHLIKHNTIAINHFLMEKNTKVYSTDLDHLEISLGMDLDGIIGYDLLRHHSINVNFDNKMMNIYELGEAPKVGEAIPFDLHISIPVIEGSVTLNNGEAHPGTFFIMTGAGTTLDFNSPYAKEWNVLDKTGKHYSYLVKGLSDTETPHYEGHVQSFSFGNQKVEDLPIGISTATGGIQADKKVSGIIGSQILRLYNFSLDYGSKTLHLEKDQTYSSNFQVNCSGIDIQLSPNKDKVLIHQVFENSPASEAGIKLNSELVKINGKTMGDVNLADVKKMLKMKGETVNLVVKQGGEEKSVSLKLRSLLE